MLDLPNPLFVFVNMFWITFLGSNASLTLSHFLSQQGYIVQVALIVVTAAVFGALVYHLVLAIPSILVRVWQLLKTTEREKFVRYEKAQADLRPTPTPPREPTLEELRTLRHRQKLAARGNGTPPYA